MKRRTLLTATAGVLATPTILRQAWADTMVGVTKTEIKIGHTIPYSGPASAYGVIGKSHVAFWKMINDKGGINGPRSTSSRWTTATPRHARWNRCAGW